jgi:predicted MFS family arabinose efflux permease
MLKRIVGTYRAAFSGLPREVWIQGFATLVNRSGTMVLPFMSLYLTTKLGFSIIAAGQVLSLYGIGAIAGSWLGGTLSDRIGPVRVQVASLAATGVGFLVLSRLTGRLPVSLAVFGLALVRLAVNLGMTVGPAVGGLLAINTVIIVAVEMVLLRALEHRDHLLLAGLGCLLVCAGFGLLPLGSSRAFAALTVVVWTAGEMLSLPFTNSVAASRAPGTASGRYMGAYSLSFSLAFVLAPAVGTAVYGRFGPTTLWAGVAATGVVLFAACALLARRFRAALWAVADAAGGMQPGREE